MLLSHKMTEEQKGHPRTLPPCQAGDFRSSPAPRHQESAAGLRGHRLLQCNTKLEQVVSVAGSQEAFASHTAPSWRSTWNDRDLEAMPLLRECGTRGLALAPGAPGMGETGEVILFEINRISTPDFGRNRSAPFAAPRWLVLESLARRDLVCWIPRKNVKAVILESV